MKTDITDIIADLVLQSAPELTSRCEYQSEALVEIKCTSPALEGQWIDAYEIKYLFSILALSDEDFAARFPELARFPEPERRQLIATLERHLERCQHCSLKCGYDLELDQRIKRVCQENSTLLLQLLEEDAAAYLGQVEIEDAKLESVCSGGGH